MFKKAKIKVLAGAKVASAKPGASSVTLTAEPAAGGASRTIEAEYLLVATGRGPATTGLGAAEAGLKNSNAATSRSTSCSAPASRASRRSAT